MKVEWKDAKDGGIPENDGFYWWKEELTEKAQVVKVEPPDAYGNIWWAMCNDDRPSCSVKCCPGYFGPRIEEPE